MWLAIARPVTHTGRMRAPSEPLPVFEFVILASLMTSIVALSTDIMLPALDDIGRDLGVAQINDAQLVISSLFLGFAVGQLIAGPLSDAIGRRPSIFIGYGIFIAGCLLSLFTSDFTVLLIGRVLQGLGAAGPRIVMTALIRDGFVGREMARIMSIIMAIFILVPAVAPALGQGVIALGGWRSTFTVLLASAIVAVAWFGLRQPETLPHDKRRPFRFGAFASGVAEACSYRAVVGYTVATGLIFGPFVGYLSSAQQIFQTSYGKGEMFPAYFAVVALAFGAAAMVNARLVIRFGMRFLSNRALVAVTVLSWAFLAPTLWSGGIPPFWAFMGWAVMVFFCVGIMFGNYNALSMEPLGHMAGLGAALIGAVSTVLALPVGWLTGKMFDGTITPLVGGFAVAFSATLLVVRWTERG